MLVSRVRLSAGAMIEPNQRAPVLTSTLVLEYSGTVLCSAAGLARHSSYVKRHGAVAGVTGHSLQATKPVCLSDCLTVCLSASRRPVTMNECQVNEQKLNQ